MLSGGGEPPGGAPGEGRESVSVKVLLRARGSGRWERRVRGRRRKVEEENSVSVGDGMVRRDEQGGELIDVAVGFESGAKS